MSASITESDWNFRIIDQRLIIVTKKNENTRKIAVLDILTNLIFTVQVPATINIKQLTANRQYLFNLKVYTSKNIEGIKVDFVSFFASVDIDQPMEDFIKAYWMYPTKICFELVEIEEP